MDVATYEDEKADELALNDIGRRRAAHGGPIFADPYEDNRAMGAFILIDEHSHDTVGAGLVRKRASRAPAEPRTSATSPGTRPRSIATKRWADSASRRDASG